MYNTGDTSRADERGVQTYKGAPAANGGDSRGESSGAAVGAAEERVVDSAYSSYDGTSVSYYGAAYTVVALPLRSAPTAEVY